MSTIATYHQALVTRVQTTLGSGVRVEPFAGRFTSKSLDSHLLRPPGVKIGVVGIAGTEALATGRVIVNTQFLAAIVTSDVPGKNRDAGALELIEAVLHAVRRQQPGTPGVESERPKNFRADNLYNAELEERGVALWGLAFQVPIICGVDDPIDVAPWFGEITEINNGTATGHIGDHVEIPVEVYP
ncbi:phage protein Gp37 [Chelatococcus asaccharovorans]|uniref:Uncharacterized protein DUF1834 n=1 Tax=Chelatococcus asaccharovorans TaxID=28210 RepID=A0A2V3UBZ9_9HYPH|nr:phage protein Gp37 [Chelatococcus asaccharovorans]MBS7703315.1 DUF1834 family protein [Chelatococcus asaccharovorans]PXW61648.1 uncharacterized protein DUF1834 [Chelatococcus asaccharovorans]